MSKTPDTPPNAKIVISLHQLWIEVEHESSYPDQMSDLSNRALDLFSSVLIRCKNVGMDIREADSFIYEGEDEDED